MQKINLRDLYPDLYKTDVFLEVTDEVHAVFLADKRADAAYERQMYRYKAYYSLDHGTRRPRKKFWRTSSCRSSSTLR